MIFVLLFEDNEQHSDIRAKHMEAHLSFLFHNSNRIKGAGPLTNSETKNPAGGLWLVEADNLTVVKQLVKEDPFWPTGLRKNVEILEWSQVFADGNRLIE